MIPGSARGVFRPWGDRLNFEAPALLSNDDDPELADRIVANIPLHLEYACTYWPQHLKDVECSAGLAGQVSRFAHDQLLFWFEVLSLKRQFGRVAVRALRDVASWVNVS